MRHHRSAVRKAFTFCLCVVGFFSFGLEACLAADMHNDSKLVAAAQKEGELDYADNLMAPKSRAAMQEAFVKRYGLTHFKFKPHLFKAGQLVARVEQELSAGHVTTDWMNVNAYAFWKSLKAHHALLKYCAPEYKAFSLLSKAGIPDGGCYFHASHGVTFTPMWNPKDVHAKFTSWYQLTNPKYKGEIILSDARKAPPYLDTFIGLRQILPLSWFEKMAKLHPFLLVRSTEIRDKVMTGEFPIAVWGYAPRAYQVRKEAKLDVSYPKEGVVLEGAFSGILAKAPHPAAAKLWDDFWFSKEGQTILVKYEGVISGRSDLDVSAAVRHYIPSISSIKVIPVHWAKITHADRVKARDEFRKIFAHD